MEEKEEKRVNFYRPQINYPGKNQLKQRLLFILKTKSFSEVRSTALMHKVDTCQVQVD